MEYISEGTLLAAVHLGKDHDANLHYVKNRFWNSVGLLFHESGKLISEQKEITGVNTTDFRNATWKSTSLLCKKAYRITDAKTCVFSDSVLCGKMGDHPITTWKSKIKWNSENNHFKDMNRIDGMPTEFEWKIFPGIVTLGLLEKIQSLMRDFQCKHAALGHWKRWKFLPASLLQNCKNMSEKWNNCQKTRSFPNNALMRV